MHHDDLAPAWLYRSEAFAEDLDSPAAPQATRATQPQRRLADWAPALGSRLRQRWAGVARRRAVDVPTSAALPGLLQPR